MNPIPTRKSIFAPSSQPRQDTLSPPQVPRRSILKNDKSTERISSDGSQSSKRASFKRSQSERKTFHTSVRPLKPKLTRKSVMQGTFSPRKLKKHPTTIGLKSHFNPVGDSSPTRSEDIQTPRMFKEYKYRVSRIEDTVFNEDSRKMRVPLNRLSMFSAYSCNIIDTRPVDSSRMSFSRTRKAQLTYLSSGSRNSSKTQKNFPPVNTPMRSSITEQGDSQALSSEISEEEELPTERLRLKKILKKGLYTIYFIGVMITFKNKVKVYGALRPLEYLEEFESYKPQEQHNSLFPILPTSLFTYVWRIILFFLLLLTAILTPVYISFVNGEDTFFYCLNILIDLGFFADVVINFLSAYEDHNGDTVTDFRKIALRYITAWFWADILAILPLDYVVKASAPTPSYLSRFHKIWRFFRFPKVFKLFKTINPTKTSYKFSSDHLNKLNKKLNNDTRFTKVLRIFANFAFLNHLAGCVWFYLAKLEDYGPDTWVQRVNIVDEEAWIQYIASLYWAFQTLTTVGYGDIAPQTSLERTVSAIWIVFGVLAYTFTVGNLSAIFLSFGVKTENIQSQLASFEDFARQANLPNFLAQKVRRCFEINHKENICHCIDPNDHLKSLPASLKTSLLLFSYYDYIRHINFLQINANLTAALLVHFKVLKLSSGEVIYREDDPSSEIYFILRGSVKFMTQRAQGIYSLAEGTYFGDIEAFEGTTRQCFCKALEPTVLLICPKETFFKILMDFPDIRAQMERMVKLRKIKIEGKLDKLRKEEESMEKDQQKVFLKKTEYVNKVLLKLPDFVVRYEQRRRREKSMLIKPVPSVTLTSHVKAKSLGSLRTQDSIGSALRLKRGHKSLQDIARKSLKSTNDKGKGQEKKKQRKEKKRCQGTLNEIKSPELESKREPGTLDTLAPLAGGTVSRTEIKDNSSPSQSKCKDMTSLETETKEERMDTIFGDVNNGTLVSLINPEMRSNASKTFIDTIEEASRRNSEVKEIERHTARPRIRLIFARPISFAQNLISSIRKSSSSEVSISSRKVAPAEFKIVIHKVKP